jgi:hypothetical protein
LCPKREIVAVADGAQASLKLLEHCRKLSNPMTFISRFGLDGALYEAAPPRRPGQIGRARLKGERLPNLSTVAQQASDLRRCARLGAKGVVDTGADLLLVAAQTDTVKVRRAIVERLTDAVCYAA